MDTSKNDDSGESEKEGEETKTNKINLNKTDINVDINSKINEYTSPSTAADSNEKRKSRTYFRHNFRHLYPRQH